MNARNVICSMTAAALLMPAAVGVARTESAEHAVQPAGHDTGPVAEAVRRATERFRDVNEAIAAGYARFQGCVSGPAEGAMGVHYAKDSLFDDQLDLDNPEVLVYEPKKEGRLQLVAAEYITDADAWQATHDDYDQPELMGHLLHFAPGPNRYGPTAFYELHVWAWRNNPRGTFADWNPAVSCADWTGPSF